ncbi:hypothetical protein ACFFIF_02510 [Vagococcus entomophilus]|uniref:DUF1430 domain-containing protein n=1 Tax=Vagococcus entomophilus TaxID=1160095 RepID=A0A430AJP8_9ENTE|nr:hypothetical protein [Vagococcus entomophilus]RSU08332.1 hypothetical protein CBF30_03570 [Vagococcus entomophilus]
MKKMLVLVFFLLSLFSLSSTYFQGISEETKQFRQAIFNNSQVVVFSEKNIIGGNDQRKEEIVKTIKELSEKYQVNVYKNDINDETPFSVFFSQVNVNSKKIFQDLRMMPPKNKERFTLKNGGLLSSNNKYILKDFNQLIHYDILSGRYIIQYQQKKLVLRFYKDLQMKLNIQIETKEENNDYSTYNLFQIINIIIIITLTLIILFFYYLNYKNNTIKSYFGYSDLQLVNDIYYKILPALTLLVGISFLFTIYLIMKEVSILLVLKLILRFWKINIIFSLISYLLVALFVKISKKDWLSFKGKKPLKFSLIVGVLFIYCIVPLIAFGLSETVPLAMENINLTISSKKNQKMLKDYFYLPLLSAGVSPEDEERLVPSFQNHTALLEELYKEGLLLFKLEDSTRARLNGDEYEEDYDSNEMWVSPSYLESTFVEVKDLNGRKVSIDNKEKKLIILIPEKFKDNIDEVKAYYNKSHNFYNFEVAQEFSKEAIKKEPKDIEFIFIKNNPKLAFWGSARAKLSNPILRVLTPNNIQKKTSVYADIILGQTDYFFVKNKGDLKEIIKKNDVYSEFPVQISAHKYLMSNVNEDMQIMGILFVIIVTLILLYYIVSYFLSSVFISMNSKKIKLYILFGIKLKLMMISYSFVFILPWLSIIFFNHTKEILFLICCISVGSIILTLVNFNKIYKNVTVLE